MHKGRQGWPMLLLMLVACQAPGQTMSGHEGEWGKSERAMRAYRANWHQVPDGEAPSDWVDVQAEGHAYPWLYGGSWRVQRVDGEPRFEVPEPLRDPPEPLTFRRYNGGAFGIAGALPAHYRVAVEGRSMGGSMRFNGYGELACQVVYLNPTSYVEVLQTDENLYIWQADHAPPMQGAGWTMLAKVPHRAAVGEWIHFGAEVDTTRGTVTALLDDVPVASASPSLLLPWVASPSVAASPSLAASASVAGSGATVSVSALGPRRGISGELASPSVTPHLTIRATGNAEQWRSVAIEEVP